MSILLHYRYALMYALCVSFVAVYRQFLMVDISPICILSVSSFISIVYFHTVNLNRIKLIYQKIWSEKLLFLNLNLVVGTMWIAAFFSIYYSSAAMYTYEFFIVGGAIAFLFHPMKNHTKLVLLMGHILLVGLPFIFFYEERLGIFLGLITGCLGFIYNHLSAELCKKLNLSASQILASRFWFLFFVSTAWFQHLPHPELNTTQWMNVVVLALLSFVLQIWLNQQSILTVGAKRSTYICGLVPFITFVLQGMMLHQWILSIFLLSVFGGMHILLGLMMQKKVS